MEQRVLKHKDVLEHEHAPKKAKRVKGEDEDKDKDEDIINNLTIGGIYYYINKIESNLLAKNLKIPDKLKPLIEKLEKLVNEPTSQDEQKLYKLIDMDLYPIDWDKLKTDNLKRYGNHSQTISFHERVYNRLKELVLQAKEQDMHHHKYIKYKIKYLNLLRLLKIN